MKHQSVIVTDGLWRKSLSTVRALGKKGFSVSVTGSNIFTTSFWSSFTKQHFLFPTAAEDPQRFIIELKKVVQEVSEKPVLFPMEDASLMAVVQNRSFFERESFVLLPPSSSLEIAQDKARTMKTVQKLGLPGPETFFLNSVEEFLQKMQSLKHKDYIVKPQTGSGSAGIVYELKKTDAFWRKHWKQNGKLLIQEKIPSKGEGVGVCLLYDKKGKCKASFVHKRLQQYPNSGGPSTDRIAIEDPELVKMSRRLLEHLKWSGVAMVEWKVDTRDGSKKILEINPRFWGSLELAVRAGVNFPFLYCQAARGETVQESFSYTVGTRCRWLIPGDILRYLTQPIAERESLWKFLQGLPELAEEWDKRDIKGFIGVIICTISMAFQPKFWKYLLRG